MALEISKTFTVKATPAEVWAFLLDVPRAAGCMPGAAIGERLDDRTYAGTMTVKVGPITANYKGKLVFERLDEAARTAEIVATGQETRGKGGADMRMTGSVREVAPGETEVTAVSRVNISGILAQMGRGMIQDVSDQLFQMFSQRMRAELEQAAPATTVSPSVSPAGPEAPPPPPPAALDVGSLGARAAGRAASRTLLRPGFWIMVLALCILVYLLSR
jgi:carbon monoxide dehydrogenase subunit G